MLLEKDKSWVVEQIDAASRELAEAFKEKLLEKDRRIDALEFAIAALKQSPPQTTSTTNVIATTLPVNLPPGVSRHRDKYRARRNGTYVGIFGTIDEAATAYQASGHSGTSEGTVGPTGNAVGTSGPAGPSWHDEGTKGNTEGTAGSAVLDGEAKPRKRGPKVYPLSGKSPCRHLFYYHATDDGSELLTRCNNREECIGFCDSEQEVREAIEDYLAENGADVHVLETLFDPVPG